MEQLGFSVPELARNIALQVRAALLPLPRHVHVHVMHARFRAMMQEEKYLKYVDGLRHMLDRYHKVLRSLDYAEVWRNSK